MFIPRRGLWRNMRRDEKRIQKMWKVLKKASFIFSPLRFLNPVIENESKIVLQKRFFLIFMYVCVSAFVLPCYGFWLLPLFPFILIEAHSLIHRSEIKQLNEIPHELYERRASYCWVMEFLWIFELVLWVEKFFLLSWVIFEKIIKI